MGIEFDSDTLARVGAAVRDALSRWSVRDDAALTLLNISENATFRIDEPGPPARSLVLRVHRRGYHSVEEIRSELAWIEALRDAGVVDTPAPLRGIGGDLVQVLPIAGEPPRHAVAFAFAAGTEPAPGGDLPGWFETLGTVTARMHRHTRGWRAPPGFRRKAWDFEAMFGAAPLWGDWRSGVGLTPDGRGLLARALEAARLRLAGFGRAPERFGLVHADLRLANLLVDGPQLRIIDFDDCGFSWHLWDFAAAVSFMEDDPAVETLREAWLAGYRTVSPLRDREAAELPTFLLMRRVLLVAWIASHPEVPIARELGAGFTHGALAMAERYLAAG